MSNGDNMKVENGRNKKKVLRLAGIAALALLGVLCLRAVTIMAASSNFVQTNWSGGASGDTAADPTNQTGWTKYASKDSFVTAGASLTLATTSGSVVEDTDTDFDAGTLSRTAVSGTGTSAVVTLEATSDDPFETPPQQWTSGNYTDLATAPGSGSSVIPFFTMDQSRIFKAGTKLYATMNYNSFGIYDIATEKWTFKRAPVSFGNGNDIAYPGSGNYLYITAGGGTKTFMRYDYVSDVWLMLNDAPYPIAGGSCIVGTGHGTSGRIYCVYGYGGNWKFGYYDISTGTWHADLINTPEESKIYAYTAQLLYAGSGDDIYWMVSNSNNMYKYTIVGEGGSWSSELGATSNARSYERGGGANYIDGYIYSWTGANTYLGFDRYNVSAGTWEDLTNLGGANDWTSPRAMWFDMYSPTYLFDPGSGDDYEFFTGYYGGLCNTQKLNKTTLNWTYDIKPLPNWDNDGCSSVYDGNDYIYYKQGESLTFYRYSISGDSWERLADITFGGSTQRTGGYDNLEYYDGKVYFVTHYYGNYFGYYTVSSNTWTDLSSSNPPPASCGINGGGLQYVNYSGTNYLYCLRGGDTTTFYRYNLDTPGWTTMTAAPGTVTNSGGIAYPGTGAYLYVLRGKHTNTFWRYHMGDNTWEAMADKYSDSEVQEDRLFSIPGQTNYIYQMIAAYDYDDGFRGFQRYNITTDTWEWLAPPDVYYGDYGTLCATATYVYMWTHGPYGGVQRYNVSTGAWTTPTTYRKTHLGGRHNAWAEKGDTIYVVPIYNMPTSTMFTFSKTDMDWKTAFDVPITFTVGSKAAYLPTTNYIFFTRGGSDEFWRYDTVGDSWTQMADTPYASFTQYTSLEAYDSNTIYAFFDDLVTGAGRTLFKYTVSSNSWDAGVSTPSTYTSYAGRPLIAMPSKGGLYWASANYRGSYFYNVTAETWTPTPTSYTDLYNPDAAGATFYYPGSGDDLYLFTGNFLWKYDLTADTWVKLDRVTYMTQYNPIIFGETDRIYIIPYTENWSYPNANRVHKYKPSTNEWESPIKYSGNQDPARSFMVSDPYQQRVFYVYEYRYFYSYDVESQLLVGMDDNSDDYITSGGQAIYPSTYPSVSDYFYVLYGQNTVKFNRYNMRMNKWTALADIPDVLDVDGGYCGAGTSTDIYAARGGDNTQIYKYNIANDTWSSYGNTPNGISPGSAMCYPERGKYIYILRGGSTSTFYRMDISGGTPSFTTLADAPFITGDGATAYSRYFSSAIYYPGAGDYLYVYAASTIYRTDRGDCPRFYRYSISQNSWEELPGTPLELRYRPNFVKLKDYDDYIIATGSLYYYQTSNKPAVFYLWKSGTFTSQAIAAGDHGGFTTMTWSNNSYGEVEVKVRSAATSSMADATDWSTASYVTKGQDISSLASVSDEHPYIQYRIYMYAYDLAELPTVDSVTFNYSTYPTAPQSLTSSKYNTTDATNRIIQLTWNETLPEGTDIRMQIRTSPDNATWSDWMGPTGTTSISYDFLTDGDYARDSRVVLSGGYAQLATDLEDFSYKQTVTVDNTGLGAATNLDVTLDIDSSNAIWSRVQSDGGDIRFFDGTNKLSYRLISFDYTNRKARVTVRIPSISSSEVKTIYMLYGSSAAVSESTTEIPLIPSRNLVGYWNFDEGSGTDVADSSASNNDGTIVGDITWTDDGKFGKALYFPGTAGMKGVEIPEPGNSSLRPSPDITVSAWIRQIYGNTYPTIVSRQFLNAGDNSYRLYARPGYNRVYAHIYNGSSPYNDYFYDTNDNARLWYHATMVKTGTTTKLYRNGVLVASASAPSAIQYTNGKETFIGADCDDSSETPNDYPFYGYIDEVTIHGRALNDSEVATLYRRDGSGYQGKVYCGIPEDAQTSPTLGASWPYREAITVTNSTGSDMTDEVVAIELDPGHTGFWSRVQNDGDDVRFVDSDNTTLLDFNLGQFSYSVKKAMMFVEVDISASSSKTIYLYYGNAGGTSVSDSTVTGTIPQTSLAGWWKLDNGSGTTATDSSETGGNGTLYNTPTWTTGVYGGALSFNGTNQYVAIANSWQNQPRQGITYGGWAYKADWSTFTAYEVLMSKTESGGYSLFFNPVTSNPYAVYSDMAIMYDNYTYHYEESNAPRNTLSPGWHHFITSRDATQQKLYIDGELVDTATYKTWPTSTYIYYRYNNPLLIGAEPNRTTAAGNYYTGPLDEIVLYARTLTPTEIISIYRGGADATIATFAGAESANTYSVAATYNTGNPVIQPVLGAYYDNDLYSFTETATKPVTTEIKYQVSNNGYDWYYHNGSNWVTAPGAYTGGYVDTASEVSANIAAFMTDVAADGEFYYRAYLHSDNGAATPQLDTIAVTLVSGADFYLDSAGGLAINSLHTDVTNDQWFQYKASLYSSGQNSPILDDVTIEYVASYITLTSPVGEEIWNIGTQYNITWNSDGLTDEYDVFAETIKIEYFNGTAWIVEAAAAPNTGTYAWTVDDEHTPLAKVRITANGWTSINDQSAATFRIVGSLALTNPTGGERWLIGTPENITWTNSNGTIPLVKLEYSINSGTDWSPVLESEGTPNDGIVTNDGTFSWTIPDSATAASTCLIRVSDSVDSDTVSTLGTPFRIIGAISTTSPTLNLVTIASSTIDVTWTTTGTLDQVDLSYSLNGSTWRNMAGVADQVTTIDNEDTYSWTIPDILSETATLKVEYTSDDSVASTTPQFYIRGLTVLSPNGDEEWELDSTHNINWSSGGTVTPPLRIWLSTDGGSTYPTLITTRSTNTPPYSWTISSGTYSTSDTCKIKVIDDEGRSDVSNAIFFIKPNPSITVTTPVVTDEFIVGTTDHNITWTTVGNISSDLVIEYAVDGGTWTAVSPAANADDITAKSYSWTAVDAISDDLQVRVRETTIPAERDTQTYTIGESATFKIVSPTITITAPVSGAIWSVGDTAKVISWTNVGTLIGNLTLDYSVDYNPADPPSATWNTIATFAQTSSHTWAGIPAEAAGSAVYFRISDSRTPTVVTDVSDDSIQILAHQRITLDTPILDEVVIQGDFYDVAWTWDGEATTSTLTIKFSTDSGTTYPTTLDSLLPNSPAVYSWYVPQDIETATGKLWIYDTEDPLVESFSPVFTISIPKINITAPLIGNQWYATGDYNVTWGTIGTVGSNLSIQYSIDGGAWTSVSPAPTGQQITNKSYAWKVVNNAGSTAQIKITDTDRPTVTKTSDTFSIIAPTLTITAPDGSETGASAWVVGTDHDLTWTTTGGSVGAVDPLKIRYTTNGSTYTTIADITDSEVLTSDAGSYTWTVPNDVSDSVQVKIYDINRVATTDTSEMFEIAPPSITITAPNGGESWIIGTEHNVTWYTVGNVIAPLEMYYTPDGTNWTEISAFDGTNDGSYAWTVPDDYSVGLAQVKIQDSYATPRVDQSNTSFTIALPTISVDTPDVLWSATDTKAITWSSVGTLIGDLKIEWSTNNFTSTNIISSVVDKDDISYDWLVPEAAISTTLRIRITDLGRTQTWAKNNIFTVLPIPVITVSAPDGTDTGADAWRIGKEYTITWSDNGGAISNNLLLQYSVNNGTDWTTIETGVANTGTYAWTVPLTASASDTSKIRVHDNVAWKSGSNCEDDSVAFEIAIPRITLTSPATGVDWAVGDSAPITWTTDGFINENLTLQYSLNGGTNYYAIASGEGNDGTYTWTVPDVTSETTKIKIIDASSNYGGSQVIGLSGLFNIIATPTITVTAPNGEEEYVLGDTLPFTWTSQGLQVENVKIEISSDNFVSAIQTVIASTPNDGSYNWVIPDSALSGAAIKARISMVGNSSVNDVSGANFRIRGGFTITAPTLNQRLIVGKSETVTWTTRGTIANVKVMYSATGAAPWTTITSSTTNNNSYSFTIPGPRVETAIPKIRIENASDDTVYAETPAFRSDYYTITWRVVDYDTNAPLQLLKVQDGAWSDQAGTIESPVDHDYPYALYTTFWNKDGYIERATEWTADDDKEITVPLENQLTATVEWHVLMSTSYNASLNSLTAKCWLERRGKLIGVVATDLTDLQSATLEIYDGDTVVKIMTTSTHDAQGSFAFAWADTTLESGKSYFVKAIISYRDSVYTSGASIDVTQAKAIQETRALIQTEATKTLAIKAAVETDIPTKITAAKAAIQADTASILTHTGTTIPSVIADTKARVETSMKAKILNRQSILRTGQEMMVRYKSHSGLSTVTVDIYDPNKKLKQQAVAMTEIGDTGIYQKAITFLNSWGEGDFTIVCSDTTHGTMDALTITVASSDLDSVAGNVAAIMGSTSGLSDVADVAETLNSQFSIIEKSLKNVGTTSVADAEDAAKRAAHMENVFSELAKVSQSIKNMQTSSEGMDLDKFYDLAEDKKEDMTYLKNKTQELKAMMNLSHKMIDNVANEPVVQTWYEYRSVVLKALIVNPSTTQAKTVPFKIYLPKEAKPEHIMSRGELKVGYDTQQGSYYVHAQFKLEPEETKEVDIELKDIWQIKPSEIESLRNDSKKVYNILRDTEFSERAKFLFTNIEENLSVIIENQKDKPVNPEDHISGYRENLERILECKEDLSLSRSLLSQTKPVNIKATWKLIVSIVIFLGLLSAGFYFMWQKLVKLSEVPTIEGEEKKSEDKK